GQRDASITPLAGAFTPGGDMIAAPVVLIDRLLGEFAGGRWVLANFSGTMTTDGVRNLARAAIPAPLSVSVVPTFATYFPGETPAVRLRVHDHRSGREGISGGEWALTLTNDRDKFRFRTTLAGKELRKSLASAWVLPSSVARGLRPGFYALEATFRPETGENRPVENVDCTNGFWIYDAATMKAGDPVTVRGASFYRGGKPYPVTGTSYMSDGVQRKFLFEPNPYLWDNDFREMKEAGINMIRTGIWTGWKNLMLDVGSVSEYPLRSLDAFILSAQRHDIPVIFTFFAFLPEMWGGVNPYMDPRSVQAQKIFLATIAARYKNTPSVIWDLINEPSFSSSDQLWLCRPNYDRHESAAWKEWLIAQAPAVDAATSAGIIRERYRQTPGEEPSLPALIEFRDTNLVGNRRLLRVGDYRLFAQEMFRRWTVDMVSALKVGGGAGQLVTVGQDEGGTYERPGPHFFGKDVDFTSMHNWWYNDDLLWDSVMTTVAGKPNLIEETGVMFYEKADGRPWRSEEETRNLLERKLAVTFGSGAAGFINWLWNTNQYMDSDNEAGIGLKRPDGSLKPEFDTIRQYAKFFTAHSEWFTEKEQEAVVLVIPHSNMFSTRDSATEATKNAVRAMEYHCRIPLRTVSEYTLDASGPPPRLLIFPSPSVIDREAWEKLTALVQAGTMLLITGAIDWDRYLMPAARSASLGVSGTSVTVGAEEHITVDGREYRLGFRGNKMQKVEKFVVDGQASPEVLLLPSGKGAFIWSPLPVEVSDSMEALAALYRFAAAKSGLAAAVSAITNDPSVLVRPVVYRDALMLVFVSDAAAPRRISGTLVECGKTFTVKVPARRSVVNLYGRRDGRVIATLNPSLADAF
ncbi:MAG TPA: cellulase family glycosylhydrolase, partial [Bacteroidota bacterium]|nr:cellulase family glycosylhydrolase [Bacteroidota bacterium]